MPFIMSVIKDKKTPGNVQPVMTTFCRHDATTLWWTNKYIVSLNRFIGVKFT